MQTSRVSQQKVVILHRLQITVIALSPDAQDPLMVVAHLNLAMLITHLSAHARLREAIQMEGIGQDPLSPPNRPLVILLEVQGKLADPVPQVETQNNLRNQQPVQNQLKVTQVK